MNALQTDPVRMLTADALGDTLVQELALRLSSEPKLANRPSRSRARPAWASAEALAKAVRAALREVLGTETRLVAVDRHDPLVDRTLLDLVARVPPIVHARRDRLSEEYIQVLADTYLKTEPTLRARHAIEHDNARERAGFVEEVECLTSRQLAELAGHKAENSSATAARWKKAGRMFGLPWRGADLFPAFQFVEGKPKPVVGRILATLPEMSPWQTAFWFVSTNSWLGGATPADCLRDEERVVAAASREAEPLVG